MPNFQAILERPEARVRVLGLSHRGIPRRRQFISDAQEEVVQLKLEEIADSSRIQKVKTFLYVDFSPLRALDGAGSIECPAEARCYIRFDRPPSPYGNL